MPRPAACANALLPMPPRPTTIASYITGALAIERRPALPLGEMLVEAAPFGVLVTRVCRDKFFAQHRLEHAGLLERARCVQQVLGQRAYSVYFVSVDVHVDVEAFTGIARVFDSIEPGGENAGLQQIRIRRSIGKTKLE